MNLIKFIKPHLIFIFYLLFFINILFYVSSYLYSFAYAEESEVITILNRKVLQMDKKIEMHIWEYLKSGLHFVEKPAFPDTETYLNIMLDTEQKFDSVQGTEVFYFNIKDSYFGPHMVPMYSSEMVHAGELYSLTDTVIGIEGSDLPTEYDKVDQKSVGLDLTGANNDRPSDTYMKKYMLYLGKDRIGHTGPSDMPHYRVPVKIFITVWR